MKPRHLLLVLAAGLLLPGLLPAQTSGVPEFISYQGLVLDSTGAPVGTGTPVNRKVIFRVWDHATNVLAANLIYSEEQTVTIADGKFSVLVGQGVGSTGGQFPFSETAYGPDASPSVKIANAFNGSARYLGVTVDDGTAAVDNEIAPRQQVVSSAFAFRSKFAETLGSGAAGGNSLTQITGGSLAVSGANTSTTTVNPQFLVTADDITERLRVGVDSTGNGTSFLQSWKEGTGATNLLLNPNGGNVGIGTTTPASRLTVKTGPSSYGFEHTDGTIRVGSYVGGSTGGGWLGTFSNHPLSFFVNDSSPKMTIGTNGNVGIGTVSPNYKLEVTGSLYSQSLTTGTISAGTCNIGATQFRGVGRSIPTGGCYIEWGNQSPGSYGQSYILNNQENGNPGIFLGEVSNSHSITASMFTQPGFTSIYGNVHAYSFVVSSDERIKSVVARSSSEADLDIVRKLRVTDYQFIDQKRGTGLQKGFIAQEVKTVVPEAVKSTGKSFIPSVYAEATKLTFDADSKTLSVTMAKAHDLKVGDLVEMTEDGTRHEWKVSGVKDDKTFAVGPVKEVPAQLFVYGKQVPDLLAVDYDRLFVSGIGAIQELVKQVDAVKLENADLKSKLAASEKRLAELADADKAFEAKLTALEKRLSTGKTTLQPVSTQ